MFPASQSPAPSSSAASTGAPLRVVVIDDDPLIRSLLEHALGGAGYAVATAADGHEGLRLHAELAPDCVITDLFMPEKEGMETIMEVRRRGPATPIVAMSGRFRLDDAEPQYLNVARALGATATLAKPFTVRQLLDTIRGVLASPGRPAPDSSCRC